MDYVEIEKYDSWEWFFHLLLKDIRSPDDKGWAFIFDRQKGLLEAISSLVPNAKHRFYLRHMYNNFKAKFKDKYEAMHYMEKHIVFLNERHYSCGMFQLVGYPCCYAITIINYYSHMINLVLGVHDFEKSTLGEVATQSVKSKVGRPKKIPAPNSQKPFSQSEPLFPLDDIPQASQFMASIQASQSRTNEISQSQIEPYFASMRYHKYLSSWHQLKLHNQGQMRSPTICIKANFCATKVCTIHVTISGPLTDAEYSTIFTKVRPTCSKKEKTTSPNI
ncbi:UNVERIFIED_CONTAM: hypothetical protein Scaly_2194800 [Sesamum calycinum]|uniref:Protein FAR1-RELATED SEQUENCE n=1 Tax=Sesamum calycinum TaxID=2727403 RepID=A0AAW2MQW7_9LAMI